MRTFATEDKRKDRLFLAWIDYLQKLHLLYEGFEFEDIYEGLGTFTNIAKDKAHIRLEDNKGKIVQIPISAEIYAHSLKTDSFYIILGFINGKWWPLDVISVASVVNQKKGEFHFTYNPLLMPSNTH